jgi:hypothetical protein
LWKAGDQQEDLWRVTWGSRTATKKEDWPQKGTEITKRIWTRRTQKEIAHESRE